MVTGFGVTVTPVTVVAADIVTAIVDEVSVPALLVAVTVKLKVPAADGVPERTPAELSVSPPGKVPVDVQVGIGLPDAVNVKV